jgi:hypothetical protein
MKEVLFGKNERGGQVFHGWVEKLLAADDAELAAMFAPVQAEAAE